MCEVYFFGVPKGFDDYPHEPTNYYQAYYDTRVNNQWQFFIRQSNDTVRYVYVRYHLLDCDNRAGSLFGVSIVLKKQYLNEPKVLIDLCHQFYNTLIEDNVLLCKQREKICFQKKNFETHQKYLDDWIKVFRHAVSEKMQENLSTLLTNLTMLRPREIAGSGENVSNETINELFLKYGGINIYPNFAADNSKLLKSSIMQLSVEELQYWRPFEKKAEKKIDTQIPLNQEKNEPKKNNSTIPEQPINKTEKDETTVQAKKTIYPKNTEVFFVSLVIFLLFLLIWYVTQ